MEQLKYCVGIQKELFLGRIIYENYNRKFLFAQICEKLENWMCSKSRKSEEKVPTCLIAYLI